MQVLYAFGEHQHMQSCIQKPKPPKSQLHIVIPVADPNQSASKVEILCPLEGKPSLPDVARIPGRSKVIATWPVVYAICRRRRYPATGSARRKLLLPWSRNSPAKVRNERYGLKRGAVELPPAVRRELGIQAGDEVEIAVREGCIVLSPAPKRVFKAGIIDDPLTGWPVLSAGPGAPPLTSEQVAEMLADFP